MIAECPSPIDLNQHQTDRLDGEWLCTTLFSRGETYDRSQLSPDPSALALGLRSLGLVPVRFREPISPV